MKKGLALLWVIISASYCLAQNVGIGTNTPQGRLQINHRSGTAMGLMLIDSTNLSSGSVEFRNVNNTRRILMQGYTASNFNNGQYLDIKSDSVFIATFQGNGRLGVNNPGPSYPLDVTAILIPPVLCGLMVLPVQAGRYSKAMATEPWVGEIYASTIIL